MKTTKSNIHEIRSFPKSTKIDTHLINKSTAYREINVENVKTWNGIGHRRCSKTLMC